MATTSPSAAPKPRPSSSNAPDGVAGPVVAIAGNPNSGKTSLFNAMTGLRRKVGNYPGITVERVEAPLALPDGRTGRLFDLPGCYSLASDSDDERVARDVMLGLQDGVPRPDVVVVVVAANALKRNLYLATQVMETGVAVVIALNMVDVALREGHEVDGAALSAQLGVPVVPVNARTGVNVDALVAALDEAQRPARICRLPPAGEEALRPLAAALVPIVGEAAAEGAALRLLTSPDAEDALLTAGGETSRRALIAARDALLRVGLDPVSLEPECRYQAIDVALEDVIARAPGATDGPTASERADRVLTHPLLGPVLFLSVMGLIFMSVYSWAGPFMDWIETGMGWLSALAAGALGEGMLTDLLVDGVIAGVGNVIIFVPQIAILFLFLTILEDCGYLARAAFLIDRVMKGVGLSGKAFVPLMSSFACAIPGIMATRTMRDTKSRMITIMVAPLMSCSARLPVYALLIGAFIPHGYQWITLLSMYALSVGAALLAAWVFGKTLFRGAKSTFILELPPYTRPSATQVVRTMAGRSWVFIREAGTVILAISIVLWFLAYFPRDEAIESAAETRIAAGEEAEAVENWAAGAQLEQSYAGRLGHLIEPVIEPLGYDWRTGVGVIASFAAREVLVSTMGIIYSVGEADEESLALREKLQNAKRPDGTPAHSVLSAISLMVFFVLACQCMATLAVVKRETNSWRWPLFMFGYMTALAYVAALLVFQGGTLLGFGP
ncbi:MAG: ferrous iron transport protein B [Planctomycetota bacterium]|nr:ferrous iron transport protein B [Planctomycetota bacterium]